MRNLLASKIPTLLSSLSQAFVRKPQNSHVYLKWLRSLLRHHITILLNPSQQEVVREIRALLDRRTRHIAELARLKGKMSVVLGAVDKPEQGRPQPKLKYVESRDNEIVEE